MVYKGPGHTVAGTARRLTGIDQTDYVDFGAGAISARTNLFPSSAEAVAYALFRLDDGNGVAPIFQHATYTGDGTGARTIDLTPLFGLRPLFGLVLGDTSGRCRYRDVGHAGTVSTESSTGTSVAANGIRGGGVDQILVGSDLNVTAITYHVFVIPGSATGTADGWSEAGTFYVSEPNSPTPPGDFAPIEVTPGASEPGGGEGTDPIPGDLTDDLADATCVAPSTRLMNLALQRIGINLPVVTLATELSAEAIAIRTAYDETLQETLRALPWPFATRYITLALSAGTSASPANPEWQYAYAIPADCLFARRLVVARGAAVDPTPPPFILAGGVIFTNQAGAVLEYTQRVHCPAVAGDATFRSAWAWRLAAELAPALTRMADKQVHCLEMWQHTIGVAERFLRLGTPGLRPAADPADLDAGASAVVKLSVINQALLRIGAQTIASLSTEQSREALSALLVYEPELRTTLRDYPWPWATRYATLVQDPAAVDPAVAANPDWAYSYRYPASAIYARRLVKAGVGRGFDPAPIPYLVGSDATGLLVFTNEADAVLEYTIRVPLALTDDYFRDSFAWRLAAALAPSLAVPDPEAEEQTGRAMKSDTKDPRPSEGGKVRLQQLRMERARWAWGMYLASLRMALASSSNEEQREPDGDASWIRDRDA